MCLIQVIFILHLVTFSLSMKPTISFQCRMLKDLSWECNCPQGSVVLTLGNHAGCFIVCDMTKKLHFMKQFGYGMIPGFKKRKRRYSEEENGRETSSSPALFVLKCTLNDHLLWDCKCPENNVVLMLKDSRDFFIVCDSRYDVVLMKSASFGKVRESGQLTNMFQEEEKTPGKIESLLEAESQLSSKERDDLEEFEKEIEGSKIQQSGDESRYQEEKGIGRTNVKTHQIGKVEQSTDQAEEEASDQFIQDDNSSSDSTMQSSSYRHTTIPIPQIAEELSQIPSTSASQNRTRGTKQPTHSTNKVTQEKETTVRPISSFSKIGSFSNSDDGNIYETTEDDAVQQRLHRKTITTTNVQNKIASKSTTSGEISKKITTNSSGVKKTTEAKSGVTQHPTDMTKSTEKQLTTTTLYSRIAELFADDSSENDRSNHDQSPTGLDDSEIQRNKEIEKEEEVVQSQSTKEPTIIGTSEISRTKHPTTIRRVTPKTTPNNTYTNHATSTAKPFTTSTRHQTTTRRSTTTVRHSTTSVGRLVTTARSLLNAENVTTVNADITTTVDTAPTNTTEDSTKCFVFGKWLKKGETYGNKYLCHYECMDHGVIKRICNNIRIRG